MTRFLSQILQAPEPLFHMGLQKLEAANDHPKADIRTSIEVRQAARTKLRSLGLDPDDTTAEELYHSLQERVKADDARLVKTLRTRAATYVSAEGDAVSGIVHVLNNLADSKRCFAIKTSSLKNMIKQVPPKKALKRLGYRSLESCLKHESPLNILAAAWICEGANWQQRFTGLYRNLRPGDFEDRRIAIVKAEFKRWPELADEVVTHEKQNLLSFREMGALIFLPLPGKVPAGVVTASLSLALHELNEIRACGTYLKLYQVRPDFAAAVQTVIDEPRLSSQLLDRSMPWHLVHRYYAKFAHDFSEAVFEPYLQLDDIAWLPIEQTLSKIEPSFNFWEQSSHLGVLHNRQPVSLNIIDAALNCCNQLPFEKRIVHYFQSSLWHELLLRYLRPDTVEKSVLKELQPQLAEELAIV